MDLLAVTIIFTSILYLMYNHMKIRIVAFKAVYIYREFYVNFTTQSFSYLLVKERVKCGYSFGRNIQLNC